MDSRALLSVLIVAVILNSAGAASPRLGKATTGKSGKSSSGSSHSQQTTTAKNSSKTPTQNSSKGSSKDSANSLASARQLDNSKAALEAQEVERITRLEQESIQAELKKNGPWFQDYLADDLTGANPDGVFEDKARRIARNLDPAKTVESKTYDELKVRAYGEDIVIATGRLSEKGKSNNAEYNVQRAFTHVWVNRLGQWQQVAIQESLIPPGSAPSQSAAPAAGQAQTAISKTSP